MSEQRRTNEHWDDKKRVECVTTWLAVGKLPLVEALTGVPTNTLRAWKYQPWWEELVHEIQNESDQELDTKLKKIVDKSLDVVLDRITNGDFVLNSKTGEVTRVPTKLKDVHRVSVEMLDKRDLIRNRKELVKVEVSSVDDYLKKLAGQFAQFVKKQLPKTYEAEPLGFTIVEENGELKADAIHDEREARLQEGSGEIHEPSGRNQEEGRTEQSSPRDGG